LSSALTITPAQRFNDLKRSFRAILPRRTKLSAAQHRHIGVAASLQQIVEMAILERALGATHDRLFIERLRAEVHQHLALAGATKPRRTT
jgi:hypothetical protein